MKTPIMETERLILRPLLITDAQAVYNRWGSDDRVTKFLSWSTHRSVADTLEWLESDIAQNNNDDYYNWGIKIKDSHELIGGVGFFFKEEGYQELGYTIMYDYWNQGYTTEAARRVLQFAREELDAQEIRAYHAVDNPASGKVMEKCGFTYSHDNEYSKFDGSVTFQGKYYRL